MAAPESPAISACDSLVGMPNAHANTAHATMESIAAALMYACIVLLLTAISLPPMFRFGVEKGRLVMFLLIFLVCGGTGAITSITSDIPDGGSYLALALPGVAVAAIVLTAISIPLSLRMYRRKRV